MPYLLQIFAGLSSYTYWGVMYWRDGRRFSLDGNTAWGRGSFRDVGALVGFGGGWLLGLHYGSGRVDRAWRTAEGIIVDTGNGTTFLTLGLGRMWEFPLNPHFSSYLTALPYVSLSHFHDTPDFPEDTSESLIGYGLGLRLTGGLYYRTAGGIGFGGEILWDLLPMVRYGGEGYSWSPTWGQFLGGNLFVRWERLPLE
ncbi:MAG: hypothetical protein GXO29_03295 [Thermotogae bacterium]|nr:hypothetical protein [Thermotogota bacterium]